MSSIKERVFLQGQSFRFHPELVRFPDSLISARLTAAYQFGSQLLSETPRVRILDVGSGSGHGSATIADHFRGIEVISADLDYGSLATQQDYLPTFTNSAYAFTQLKLPILPYSNEAFDTVFLMHVVEHLKSPDTAMNEIGRVIRSKGEVVVATPWRRNLVGKNPTDEHVYIEKELLDLLENSSFVCKLYYIVPDEAAWKVHSRKKQLARIPFARSLRDYLPHILTERALRRGIADIELSAANFSLSSEINDQAIDLLAVGQKR